MLVFNLCPSYKFIILFMACPQIYCDMYFIIVLPELLFQSRPVLWWSGLACKHAAVRKDRKGCSQSGRHLLTTDLFWPQPSRFVRQVVSLRACLDWFSGLITTRSWHVSWQDSSAPDLLDSDAPLFLLAGKASRNFSKPEDKCWALIAMDINVPNPQYYGGLQMDRVRTTFFEPLLGKYQWRLSIIGS